LFEKGANKHKQTWKIPLQRFKHARSRENWNMSCHNDFAIAFELFFQPFQLLFLFFLKDETEIKKKTGLLPSQTLRCKAQIDAPLLASPTTSPPDSCDSRLDCCSSAKHVPPFPLPSEENGKKTHTQTHHAQTNLVQCCDSIAVENNNLPTGRRNERIIPGRKSKQLCCFFLFKTVELVIAQGMQHMLRVAFRPVVQERTKHLPRLRAFALSIQQIPQLQHAMDL
jgi:hypothetical protein